MLTHSNRTRWPVIALIIIAGLIIFAVVWCVVRCACCGLACCCSCCQCLKCCGNCCGCCDPPKGSAHRHLDDTPYHIPNQGYHSQAPMSASLPGATRQAPVHGGGVSAPPQYAEFDVSKKNHGDEDALPEMPSWENANKKKVVLEDDSGSAMEMDHLRKPPPSAGAESATSLSQVPLMSGASPGPSSPQTPGSRSPYGQHGQPYHSSMQNLGVVGGQPGGGAYGAHDASPYGHGPDHAAGAYGSSASFNNGGAAEQGYGMGGRLSPRGDYYGNNAAGQHGDYRSGSQQSYHNAGQHDYHGLQQQQPQGAVAPAGYRSMSPGHQQPYDDGYGGRHSPALPVVAAAAAVGGYADRRSPAPRAPGGPQGYGGRGGDDGGYGYDASSSSVNNSGAAGGGSYRGIPTTNVAGGGGGAARRYQEPGRQYSNDSMRQPQQAPRRGERSRPGGDGGYGAAESPNLQNNSGFDFNSGFSRPNQQGYGGGGGYGNSASGGGGRGQQQPQGGRSQHGGNGSGGSGGAYGQPGYRAYQPEGRGQEGWSGL